MNSNISTNIADDEDIEVTAECPYCHLCLVTVSPVGGEIRIEPSGGPRVGCEHLAYARSVCARQGQTSMATRPGWVGSTWSDEWRHPRCPSGLLQDDDDQIFKMTMLMTTMPHLRFQQQRGEILGIEFVILQAAVREMMTGKPMDAPPETAERIDYAAFEVAGAVIFTPEPAAFFAALVAGGGPMFQDNRTR